MTHEGRRWAAALDRSAHARVQVESLLRIIELLGGELEPLESELRRFARTDPRARALQTIYGVGPILACSILAELGEARRFERPRQAVRAAGLDPVVDESGETRRRGKLAKHGSPELRWALVEAAQSAARSTSPDRPLYLSVKSRRDGQRAALTVARKIVRRSYHVLHELEAKAA